jgi:ubiquinone biosynthesis protein
MKLSTTHLKRYREIAGLFWKYGRSDLVKQMGVDEEEAKSYQDDENFKRSPEMEDGAAAPDQLANDLERMGPTYVKLGQVLAGRPDLMPDAYRLALARLQDKVKPFSYEEVERIVEKELGVRLSKAFAEFNPEPVAAASLGQVHQARLRDGRPVVVKIQRPDIRPIIEQDFEVLTELSETLDAHTKIGRRHRCGTMVEEFHLTIQHELTTGLVLAALIVGASLLMRVDTSFELFGYPGLAILCFIAAAAGGFYLVLKIFIQDDKDKRKIKSK